MRRFVDSHVRPGLKTTVVLISSDVDFASDLSDFKHRKGVHVVLLHNRNANESLLSAASECLDFSEAIASVPVTVQTKSSFQYTELLVTNIPSAQELAKSDTERKLKEIVKAWHGKVKYLNDKEGRAVLRFENGDKTSRALTNMQDCMIGRRKIHVEYNRKLFNNKPLGIDEPVKPVSSFQNNPQPCLSTPNFSSFQVNAADSSYQALQSTSTSHLENDRGCQGPTFTVDPTRIAPLSITKSKGPVSRRVRQLSDSSLAGSSEDWDSCNENSRSSKRKTRSRRRRRKSGNSRNSSIDSSINFGMAAMSVTDDIPTSVHVQMEVIGITTLDSERKIESDLRRILSSSNIIVIDLKVEWLEEVDYMVKLSVLNPGMGRQVKDTLDGMPFGYNCIKVRFCSAQDARDGMITTILDGKASLKLSRLQELCKSRFKENLTLNDVRRSCYVDIKPTLDKNDPLIQLRSNELNISSSKPVLSSDDLQSPLCPDHDPRAMASTSFSLPCVKIHLNELKQRIRNTLRSHPDGIPLESVHHCLNEAFPEMYQIIPCCPESSGGVPLEQLIEASCMTELVRKGSNKVLSLVPRRPDFVERVARLSEIKTEDQKLVEKKILQLLEVAPYHRIKISALNQRYQEAYGVKLSDELENLNMIGGSIFGLFPNSFQVMGQNLESFIVSSNKYLVTTFMLATRKILAGMEKDERYLSITDEDRYSQAFEAMFPGCKFQIVNFGLCYLEDMFRLIESRDQNMLKFRGDRVELSGEIEKFVQNVVNILTDKESYHCSDNALDEDYVRRYGSYSVPRMSYKSISGLFKEFNQEFCLIERPEKQKSHLLSLSEKLKIKYIKGNLMILLAKWQANAIPLELLNDMYLKYFNRYLERDLRTLDCQDVDDFVAKLSDDQILVQQGYLILREGFFFVSLELKAMSLLFHRPHTCQMQIQREFVPVFKKIFGEKAFLDLEYLRKSLAYSGIYNSKEEQKLRLPAKVLSILQLVSQMKDQDDVISLSEVQRYFSENFLVNDYESIPDYLLSFPIKDLFRVKNQNFVELGKSGKYFNALKVDQELVKTALQEIVKYHPKKPSRIAAKFNMN